MKIFWHTPPQITEFTHNNVDFEEWVASISDKHTWKDESHTICYRNHPWKITDYDKFGRGGGSWKIQAGQTPSRHIFNQMKSQRMFHVSRAFYGQRCCTCPSSLKQTLSWPHLWSPVALEAIPVHTGLLPQALCLAAWEFFLSQQQAEPTNKTSPKTRPGRHSRDED